MGWGSEGIRWHRMASDGLRRNSDGDSVDEKHGTLLAFWPTLQPRRNRTRVAGQAGGGYSVHSHHAAGHFPPIRPPRGWLGANGVLRRSIKKICIPGVPRTACAGFLFLFIDQSPQSRRVRLPMLVNFGDLLCPTIGCSLAFLTLLPLHLSYMCHPIPPETATF